jgi:hypothetical protein
LPANEDYDEEDSDEEHVQGSGYDDESDLDEKDFFEKKMKSGKVQYKAKANTAVNEQTSKPNSHNVSAKQQD